MEFIKGRTADNIFLIGKYLKVKRGILHQVFCCFWETIWFH